MSSSFSTQQLQKLFPELKTFFIKDIDLACQSLIINYQNHTIELKKFATSYRFQVCTKYSRALLETLSIIVYYQPVTHSDIEDIRSVGVSSQIMNTLLEREWIDIIGRKEILGRPALYATNKQFLDYFNVSSLTQLPALEELKDGMS